MEMKNDEQGGAIRSSWVRNMVVASMGAYEHDANRAVCLQSRMH